MGDEIKGVKGLVGWQHFFTNHILSTHTRHEMELWRVSDDQKYRYIHISNSHPHTGR